MVPAPDTTHWFFETWSSIEWVLTTAGAGAIAATGFIWRLISRIDRLDGDLRGANELIRERHEENVSSHKELMIEMRLLRQSLDALNRDLNARVDKILTSR